jgi:hypothetical protein
LLDDGDREAADRPDHIINRGVGGFVVFETLFKGNYPVAFETVVAVEKFNRIFAVETVEIGDCREIDCGQPGVSGSNGFRGVGLAEHHPRAALCDQILAEIAELTKKRGTYEAPPLISSAAVSFIQFSF